MKKVLKVFLGIIVTLYILGAIFLTICLLSFNDYKISEIGDKSLIILENNELSDKYKKGSLLIVEKNPNKDIKVNDEIFFYNTYKNRVVVSMSKAEQKQKITDSETTFTINGKYEMDIVTYYPSSKKQNIITQYVKQKIKFATNDNIEEVLEKILKEPPSDKLTPVISEKAKINKINLDRNSWTLKVDFSEELLTEMNAGSSMEMEILKSLVNTLGEFYDVDKVYITVEGKPYESGHYSINTEEFFKVDKEGIEEFNE